MDAILPLVDYQLRTSIGSLEIASTFPPEA